MRTAASLAPQLSGGRAWGGGEQAELAGRQAPEVLLDFTFALHKGPAEAAVSTVDGRGLGFDGRALRLQDVAAVGLLLG